MHFFSRVYATKPCLTLVDVYKVTPDPAYYEDEVVPQAIANMREQEMAKAEKIAEQLAAHNAAHPGDRFGLIQVIGNDEIEKADVARASEGEIVVAAFEPVTGEIPRSPGY